MEALSSKTADCSTCAEESKLILVEIKIPDLNIQKCFQFHADDLVREVKFQCLCALPKELNESFNYGLYYPPCNGKAGKFLDEERPLSDYPFQEPVGYLELKYKRRVYKLLNLDAKQIKFIHSRANIKRFMDFVHSGQSEKITKMCNKGLDPNFHWGDNGETPLSTAASLQKCSATIVSLVNGGALLDYRSKDGSTALHRAVERNNFDAVKTLLDLGASPNYRDSRGLTPLYYSVMYTTNSVIPEILLHDHAIIGCQDLQGWQEVHQACRNSLVHHLEHLLYYGADMNARNASGNTPLHVCAVNNQEPCARVLLFRGADKEALNYANQTPYQVAVIAQNFDLAERIKSHKEEDIVPFRSPPKYNPRRRMSQITLSRTSSDLRLESASLRSISSSPSPSNRSLPPLSSVSLASDNSTGNSSVLSNMPDLVQEPLASTLIVEHCDDVSDSSGVGTSSNSGSGETFDISSLESALALPGTIVVCVEAYEPDIASHLPINPGDIIEIMGSAGGGLLEGYINGRSGFFPHTCVQEVKLRNSESLKPCYVRPSFQAKEETSINFPTVPRSRKTSCENCRTVLLHKGRKGFGFVLRGAKAGSPLMFLEPTSQSPAFQYLDDVDPDGVAEMAGLKKGDFLIAVNDEEVSRASHEYVVNLIKESGDLLSLTVLKTCAEDKPPVISLARKFSTLPRKFTGRSPAPIPPKRDPKTTLSLGKVRAKSLIAQLGSLESEASNGKTATIRPRPNLPSPKVYASVAEMKRWKATRKIEQNGSRLMRSISNSVPELTKEQEELAARRKSHSHESLPNDLMLTSKLQVKRSNSAMQRGNSSHSVNPGPLPAVQFVKINSNKEYSSANSLQDQNSSLTSFASNCRVDNHNSHVRNGIISNEERKSQISARVKTSTSVCLQCNKQREVHQSHHDEITRFGVEQQRADSCVARRDKLFLKNSSSCPQELMCLEDGDNSSSGVSSDQDNQIDSWRRGPGTPASEGSGDFQGLENYRKKEKSLPLSPPAYDTDPDENKDQDTVSSVSTLSSSSDTVREVIRPSTMALKQSDPKATLRLNKKSNSPSPVPCNHRDPSHELNKSIEKSLQMIRRHADAAGEICFLPKVVPPPFSLDSSVAENVATISPPPEFCDSDDENRRPSFNFNHPYYKTTIRLSGGRTKVIQQGSVRTQNRPFCLPAEARNHFGASAAHVDDVAMVARRVPADFRIQSPTYASILSKYSPTPFVRGVPYRDLQLYCKVHPGNKEIHPRHEIARRDVNIHSRGWLENLHSSEYREQYRSGLQTGISSPYEISSVSRKVYQKSPNSYPYKRYIPRRGT